MNSEKVAEILRNIEAEFRFLEDLTGVHYITATLINGSFMMWSDESENNTKPIDVFKKGANE